jgi:hypothetical protein
MTLIQPMRDRVAEQESADAEMDTPLCLQERNREGPARHVKGLVLGGWSLALFGNASGQTLGGGDLDPGRFR